jgi:hypothetical protein
MVPVMHVFIASEHDKQLETIGTFGTARANSDCTLLQTMAIRRPQYSWVYFIEYDISVVAQDRMAVCTKVG